MVDDRVAGAIEDGGEMGLGERQADGVPNALAQWPGRHLDAGRVPVLGMARRLAAPLPELLDVVEREVVPREIEHRVQQHARVPARQHEAIAARPGGIGGVVAQVALPQDVGGRGERHRRSRMTRVRLLHRIHREGADGVDAEQVEARGTGGDGLRHLVVSLGTGQSRPDLAACHNWYSRSMPFTSRSTCCGLGVALAAVASSWQMWGISLRPCAALSAAIRSSNATTWARTW